MMLVLRVLVRQPLHGYAIAQRIHQISAEALHVEEGALYPALQKLVIKGWVTAAWRQSDSGREVREYRITAGGRRHLEAEMSQYRRTARAIDWLLDKA
jgi:transcriptional regulator